jgi:hypothetical protein
VGLIISFSSGTAFSELARKIDVSVYIGLERFNEEIPGADSFVKRHWGSCFSACDKSWVYCWGRI